MKRAAATCLAVLVLAGCSAAVRQGRDPIPDYEVHNRTGLQLAGQGRHGEALRHFDQAARLAPERAALHNNLGYAYLLQGATQEAAAAFETALRLDPGYPKARENLALARARATPASPAQRVPAAAPAPAAAPEGPGPLVQVAAHVFELRSTVPPARHDAAPRPFRLEVANGNGIAGMARRVAGRLRESGAPAVRITNARAFRHNVTEIQYRAGYAAEAGRLHARFQPAARLVQSSALSGDIQVRVVLGQDMRRASWSL